MVNRHLFILFYSFLFRNALVNATVALRICMELPRQKHIHLAVSGVCQFVYSVHFLNFAHFLPHSRRSRQATKTWPLNSEALSSTC